MTAAQIANLTRFQEERGIPSRNAAVGLLLDIAFEAVTSRGRRFWDRPAVALASPLVEQARALAERLRAEGHAPEAERLQAASAAERLGQPLLEALREACQTVLTIVEALDPKTQLMAEELRAAIDQRMPKDG